MHIRIRISGVGNAAIFMTLKVKKAQSRKRAKSMVIWLKKNMYAIQGFAETAEQNPELKWTKKAPTYRYKEWKLILKINNDFF